MLAVSSARFLFPDLIQRSGISGELMSLVQDIDREYQPGDIVFHVGDGSWIDMINYTDHPDAHYKMPFCGVVRGSLSELTHQGLGVQVAALEDITWQRAWVINTVTPMTPPCEQEIIQPWLNGIEPIICLADDEIAQVCLYLISHENQ